MLQKYSNDFQHYLLALPYFLQVVKNDSLMQMNGHSELVYTNQDRASFFCFVWKSFVMLTHPPFFPRLQRLKNNNAAVENVFKQFQCFFLI